MFFKQNLFLVQESISLPDIAFLALTLFEAILARLCGASKCLWLSAFHLHALVRALLAGNSNAEGVIFI